MRFISSILLFCLISLQSAWGENISLAIGKYKIDAEIADTLQTRQLGLMYRKSLCADCGMLFIFAKAEMLNFWMKNTPIPLSIAFIAADGSILNIDEMQPNTINIHGSRSEALYALEMNSNWFTQNGIKPGEKIQGLPPSSKALKQ